MTGEPTQESGSLTTRAFWLMSAKTLAFVFSFALPLLLVRRLDQTEFGLYKQVFLVVTTAINVLPLGFHLSVFYFLPRERERRGEVVFNILFFHLFVAGVVCLAFVLRPSLLANLFNDPVLAGYASVVGLVMFLWVGSSFLEYVAVANGETKLATIFIVTLQLTRTLLLLAAAMLFASVYALVIAAVVQGILQMIILLVYLSSRFKGFWRSFNWAMLRTQTAYALPFGLAGLLAAVQMDVHNYFVASHYDAAQYAIYAIGCFQLPLLHIFSDSTGAVMIPRVSHLRSQNKNREIIMLTARMMRKLAVVFFALYVFLLIIGREFIILLFTVQYLESWPIFAIYLTMVPLSILASAYDPVMRAYAEQRFFLLKFRVALVSLLLTALWFGTMRFGMVGVISIVVVTNLIERLVVTFKAGTILGVTRGDLWLFKDVGKLAVAAAAAGVVTALVRSMMLGAKTFTLLVVCGIVFSLVYLIAVSVLGIATSEERRSVWRLYVRLQQLVFWKRATNPLL